ncbi:MAG: hypothetical protein JNM31_00100 [Flavobacteriales bacterium]|nr:hypothetical protein [Flavobacteriales bacterium]
MRYLIFILLLASCEAHESMVSNVNNQEYIFMKENGKTFKRVLPIDWEPRYEGSFIRIDRNQRVLGMDIILIMPRIPVNIQGHQLVRVFRRTAPSNAQSFDIWVPEDAERIIGESMPRDLVKVGPHTWLRPNEFRLQFTRSVQ